MRTKISPIDVVAACLAAGFLAVATQSCWAQKAEVVPSESPAVNDPSANPKTPPNRSPQDDVSSSKKVPGPAVDKKAAAAAGEAGGGPDKKAGVPVVDKGTGGPAVVKKPGPVVEKKPAVDKSQMWGPSVGDDCPPATKYADGGADGSTRYSLTFEQRATKRCETAYYDFIKRDVDTTISFDFRLDPSWDFHDVWTSIFQLHSPPNPGGQWRCPISALEVVGHSLRMFDRYDVNATPVLVNGTCADEGNSIRSRTVFQDVPVQAGQWNHFELQTKLALDDSGYFIAKLNGKEIGRVVGPNTYNDQHRPFLKIGIYKPSSWQQARNLSVDYRNINIPTER